jgi:hypothetical protein
MADKTVNELVWRISVDDKSAPGLSSFQSRMNATMKDTGGVSGGFLERMAARAKASRMEQRQSGEMALHQALSSPMGMTGFAADQLGIGMQVMVAGALGQALNGASQKAVELRNALNEGEITSEEMARDFATSIPILGNFVGFFLNIRELITGEQAEIDRVTRGIKEQEEQWKRKQKLLKENRNLLAEHAVIAERLKNSAAATWLGGEAGQRFGQKAQRDAALAAMEDAKKKQLEALEEEKSNDPKRKAAETRRDALRYEVSKLQSDHDKLVQQVGEADISVYEVPGQLDEAKARLADREAEYQTILSQSDLEYAKRAGAIAEAHDAGMAAKRLDNRMVEQAEEREHEEQMLKIAAEGFKARAEGEAAAFRNDRLKTLQSKYATELTLLQQNIDAQEKEYQRIAAAADEASKAEMQARIAAMKEQRDALGASYGAEAADIGRERGYRETDQAYEREDAQRRIDDLKRQFRERNTVNPRYGFDLGSMDAGQAGIANLFKNAEAVDKEILSVEKETREYLRQLLDAEREQNRILERQQRPGVI